MRWQTALWIPVGLVAARFGDRPGRRAALRGSLSIATAAALGRAVMSLPLQRDGRAHSIARLVRTDRSTTASVPLAIASAIAVATATAIEAPHIAAPVAAIAAATVASSVGFGESTRRDVAGAALLGAAGALATTVVWPRTRRSDDVPASGPVTTTAAVSTTGHGLSIVVNAAAGNPERDAIVAEIEAGLPNANVVHIDDPDQLVAELAQIAQRSEAIGAVGGDGTIGATAAAAINADIPLAVFPGGTLNHFARDARIDSIDDAIRAVQERRLVAVDTGSIDGRTFVNTASLGSYSKLVELREEQQEKIGKWPAMVIALMKILADGDPFPLVIDGSPRWIWMIFVGNCAYEPAGFAPTTRNRLDDGMFDVRIVDGDQPFARLRLIAALLTGRLARSAVYSRTLVDRIDIEVGTTEPMLAADGEVFAGSGPSIHIMKNPRALRLFTAVD